MVSTNTMNEMIHRRDGRIAMETAVQPSYHHRQISRATTISSTIEHIAYEEAYEPGFEDMERRVPDITKITRLTGWRPTRGLPEILADVIADQRMRIANT